MVIKKSLSLSCFMMTAILLISCIDNNERIETDSSDIFSSNGVTLKDLGTPSLVEDSEYHAVLYGNGYYYFYIYDSNGRIVKEGGVYKRCPSITIMNNDVLKFRIQMGTGLSTVMTLYYDITDDILSPQYFGILDEIDRLIVYSAHNILIIRSIFNDSDYYCEITDFEDIASNLVEPFISASFLDNGCRISVTYLGDDYSEITREIIIIKDGKTKHLY